MTTYKLTVKDQKKIKGNVRCINVSSSMKDFGPATRDAITGVPHAIDYNAAKPKLS